MKYKILLAGDNLTIINDFFLQMDNRVEFLTSSIRREDILTHLNYFQPDVLCYCSYNETPESINKIASLKQRLQEEEVLLAITGSEEDCSAFLRVTYDVADLCIPKPSRSSEIIDHIDNYMESSGLAERKRLAAGPLELEALLSPGSAPGNPKKHILVVDDNATMLKVIKEHLRNEFDIATAISARTAFRFLERKKTDLILLDYEMPEINGPTFLKKLRENAVTANIPVIFVTGTTERKKIEQALIMKPQGYLLKPIDRNKLMAAIQKVLGG